MVMQISVNQQDNSLKFTLINKEKRIIGGKEVKPIAKTFPVHPIEIIEHMDRFIFENNIELCYSLFSSIIMDGIIVTVYKVNITKDGD